MFGVPHGVLAGDCVYECVCMCVCVCVVGCGHGCRCGCGCGWVGVKGCVVCWACVSVWGGAPLTCQTKP
jgi:hypothetical protein